MSECVSIPNEYHVWFDNMTELERELPAMQNRANTGRWHASIACVARDADWFGLGFTGADALRAVSQGCPELLAQVQPKIEKLRHAIPLGNVTAVDVEVRRRKRRRGDYGDTLDMHRVWSGDLDRAWERPVKEHRLTPTERYATVYIDVAMMADVTATEALWRAAAGSLIVDALLSTGVSVEVWVGGSGINTYESFSAPHYRWSGVRIKEYTQPLTMERLSVATHAMFQRTYGFGMTLAAPYLCKTGLGRSANTGLVKPLREREAAGERVFRVGKCLSEEEAVREVRRVIDQLKPKHQECATVQ